MSNNLPLALRLYQNSDYTKVLNRVASESYLRKILDNSLKYQMLRFLKLYDSKFYVLEDEIGSIVAAGVIRKKLCLKKLRSKYWFYGIEVQKGARGKGYGNILVQQMINLVKNIGAKEAYLKVDKQNEIAVKLYQKLGFQIESKDSSNLIMIAQL